MFLVFKQSLTICYLFGWDCTVLSLSDCCCKIEGAKNKEDNAQRLSHQENSKKMQRGLSVEVQDGVGKPNACAQGIFLIIICK